MTDNTTLPGTGDVIADEDIGGVKHQLIKLEYGTAGTATKVDASHGLPTAAGYVEFSGSAAANNTDLVSQDVSAYRWVTVQLTGTWTATVSFQYSTDNSNWVSCPSLVDRSAVSSLPVSTATANGIYTGPVFARYFRVRTTAYTSGTVSAVAGFSSQPATQPAMPVIGKDSMVDTISPAGLYVGALGHAYNGSSWDRVRAITSTKGTTGLGIPSAGMLGFDGTNYQAIKTDSLGVTAVGGSTTPPGDGTAMTTSTVVAGGPTYLYNGSTWDRVRGANSADGSSGTGLVGVGGLVWDGTFWNRAKSLGASGVTGVTPTPGTTGGWSVSSQTALSTTVVSVKSSAGTLGGYMIFNSNTAVAYVQVFNVASGSVTLGTTAPTYVLSIPAGSAANLELTCGVNHSTAISVAATTAPTGSTAPTTALVAALFFK